jgi:hypothetical protein
MQKVMRMTLKEAKSLQAYTNKSDERRGVLEREMRHVERRRQRRKKMKITIVPSQQSAPQVLGC